MSEVEKVRMYYAAGALMYGAQVSKLNSGSQCQSKVVRLNYVTYSNENLRGGWP